MDTEIYNKLSVDFKKSKKQMKENFTDNIDFLLMVSKKYNDDYKTFNNELRKLIRIFENGKININYKILENRPIYKMFRLSLNRIKSYKKKLIDIFPDISGNYEDSIKINKKFNKIDDHISEAALNFFELRNNNQDLIKLSKSKKLYKVNNNDEQLNKFVDEYKQDNKEKILKMIDDYINKLKSKK